MKLKLHQYPKYREFEDWYENNMTANDAFMSSFRVFNGLPIEFQIGVYLKYFDSLDMIVRVSSFSDEFHYMINRKVNGKQVNKYSTECFSSFEDLLVTFFKNECQDEY